MANIPQTQNFPPNYYGTMVDDGPAPPPPAAPPGRNPYARRAAAGIPIPPMPVIPPEGIAPVTDPASTGTAPDASPTTMVLQYLKARGYTPSSENVRRALEANQRDPGVIPGLISDRPATDAEDMAAMRAAGVGGAGGAGRGGGRGLPVPPIPPNPERPGNDTPSNQGNTSAAPSSWRGPFSGPPDPLNAFTTTTDQGMRAALPNGPSMDLPPPTSGATAQTSDYVRAPGSPPVNPWDVALNRATGVPPEVPPPPDISRINAPPPQLALPPPAAPPIAQPDVAIPQPAPAPPPAPMPEVPNVVGQAARPPISTSTTLRGPGSTAEPPGPKIAPGPRIQGAPIIASPAQKAIPKIGLGIATRNPGMIAGGVASALPELGPYILKNLHLQ